MHAAPGVAAETGLYFQVTAVLLAGVLLVAAWFMAGAQRGRPWDAMLFAAAPTLVLAGLINWDILAVAAVAGALWAWARGRPVLTGVMVGLGTATKLYPLFLLGALLVVCLRRRCLRCVHAHGHGRGGDLAAAQPPRRCCRASSSGRCSGGSTPNGVPTSARCGWCGSRRERTVTPGTINLVSWVLFAAVCVAVLVLGLRAPRPPRVAQLAFLVVAGFLLVNKVYSPQYVLWLLPLAVLARPRWRDLLVWQSGEVLYFAAVWFYLGDLTASSVSGGADRFYWVAIVLRVAAQLYLVAVVVRDVLRPWHDPVADDAVPLGGPRRRSRSADDRAVEASWW